MKKKLKQCRVICLGMLGVGIIFLIIGLFFGGEISYSINMNEQKVITKSSKSKDYVEKNLEIEAFSELQLDMENVTVELKTGDSYQVQYCLLESEIPTMEVKDGVLSVNEKEKKFSQSIVNFQLFDFEWNDDVKKDYIVITIPEEVEFSDLNVTVNSGNILLKDFLFETGNFVTEYGDIEMSDVIGENGNIKSASGDITLKNAEIENYEITNEYGDLVLENSKGKKGNIVLESTECKMESLEMKELQITNEYGKIEFAKSDITFCKVENESGEINMNDCKGEEVDLKADYGDVRVKESSLNHVKVICESGDTEINLLGTISEYDLNLATESGVIEVNEEKSEGNYKRITNGEKSVSVQNEYGDIKLSVK